MKNNWLRAAACNFLSLRLAPCLTVFCAIFCASLISTPAAAQDAKATPSSTIQTQDIVARPIPERTVGLDPGKIVKWTLKDAILAALENNVDIQLEQENVRFVQYDLIAAQGFYDPTATSRIRPRGLSHSVVGRSSAAAAPASTARTAATARGGASTKAARAISATSGSPSRATKRSSA